MGVGIGIGGRGCGWGWVLRTLWQGLIGACELWEVLLDEEQVVGVVPKDVLPLGMVVGPATHPRLPGLGREAGAMSDGKTQPAS